MISETIFIIVIIFFIIYFLFKYKKNLINITDILIDTICIIAIASITKYNIYIGITLTLIFIMYLYKTSDPIITLIQEQTLHNNTIIDNTTTPTTTTPPPIEPFINYYINISNKHNTAADNARVNKDDIKETLHKLLANINNNTIHLLKIIKKNNLYKEHFDNINTLNALDITKSEIKYSPMPPLSPELAKVFNDTLTKLNLLYFESVKANNNNDIKTALLNIKEAQKQEDIITNITKIKYINFIPIDSYKVLSDQYKKESEQALLHNETLKADELLHKSRQYNNLVESYTTFNLFILNNNINNNINGNIIDNIIKNVNIALTNNDIDKANNLLQSINSIPSSTIVQAFDDHLFHNFIPEENQIDPNLTTKNQQSRDSPETKNCTMCHDNSPKIMPYEETDQYSKYTI
jgi:hypothetical protein